MGKYPEQKVDAMRKQKDEELVQYRKEIERALKFDVKKHMQQRVEEGQQQNGGPPKKIRVVKKKE